MSAEVELLRRAAFHMRERALDATPGPWRDARLGGEYCVEQGEEIGGHMLVETAQCADGNHADKRRQDVEHIASWDPAVALAVADWLEDAANAVEGDLASPYGPWLTVARRYLGEVSDAS